jgi:release factor glutamine methyltransferase
VVAVDISRRAVLAARVNALLNQAHVRAVRGDLFTAVSGQRFDLIVSNPPYLPTPDGKLPERGLARAWEGGIDGRSFIDRICAQARAHLHPGGVLVLVHSSVCGEAATLAALRHQGLETEVAARHRGALGPLLGARRAWLSHQGLLTPEGEEEMLVIRARLAADAPAGQETTIGRQAHPAAAR